MSACCRFAGPVWTGLNPQFDYRMGGAGAAYRSSKVALIALTVGCAQALAAHGSFKVNALAPGLCATNLNSPAAEPGGDPAEAAAQAVSLSQLSAEVPTGGFCSWDGTVAAWWGVQPLSMLSSSLAGGCRRSGSGHVGRARIHFLGFNVAEVRAAAIIDVCAACHLVHCLGLSVDCDA